LNHRLRGAESDADEEFVRALAARHGLRVHCESVTLPEGNTEQEGRNARREFFARLRAAGIIGRIATGHTRSDQAETVLYRLMRGSGTAGLSGIMPVTAEGVIRPLLECTRAEVELWAREHALQWRDDHTNADPAFMRNRIRRHLLPALVRDYSEALPGILAATAEIARDEEDYWQGETGRLAREFFQTKSGAVLLRADRMAELHPAVARRLLRKAVATVKGNLRGTDLTHIEAILNLTRGPEGHGRVQAPGIDVFRSFEWLRIAPPRTASRFELDYCFPVGGTAAYDLPEGNAAICLEIRNETVRGPYNEGDEADWERVRAPVELRNWHPGDEFQPPGRLRRKIKTLFQEARVPIWERHSWPVLTSAGEIFWTRGFGTAEGFLPAAGTRTVLRVYELARAAQALGGHEPVSGESDQAV
jgi:tRNA(Ile)-lysidine synthase